MLPDGRKVFIWNALPGEEVEVELSKTKRSYAEAVALDIKTLSSHRVKPKEPSVFLSTSPWQIMDFDFENSQKAQITREAFMREQIVLDDFIVVSDDKQFGYRNKMEFSFYGDEDGVHLAFYDRGTHRKQIVQGSALAMDAINKCAADLLQEINRQGVRAGDLKSVILRAQQDGKVVAALFTKLTSFPELKVPPTLKGLKIYHSNPKSPASVPTKIIKTYGDYRLTDSITGKELIYDPVGFFQVNIPVFEKALSKISTLLKNDSHILDLYSGVGSIGLNITGVDTLVELDEYNANMAKINSIGREIEVIQASAEEAIDYIDTNRTIIVDPPRAGLHTSVTERMIAKKPKKICYLSCNPATQARDSKLLVDAGYKIRAFEVFNFFPRTPHIESLLLLER